MSELFVLSKEHIKELIAKGYAEVTLPNGEKIIIDSDDIVIKKEDLDRFIEKLKGGEQS